MDSNLTTAIVSASATALVAIVALILNSKRFEDMGKRLDDFGKRFEDFGKRFDDMNRRIDDMGQRIGRVEKQTRANPDRSEGVLPHPCRA